MIPFLKSFLIRVKCPKAILLLAFSVSTTDAVKVEFGA